ncbi:MAG TPA: response regulator [Gemmatimonadales bacterium]|nr:response regulator [Gemmatimonadales bacterium]
MSRRQLGTSTPDLGRRWTLLWWGLATYAVVLTIANYTYWLPAAISDPITEYLDYLPFHLANIWALTRALASRRELTPATRRALQLLRLALVAWILGDLGYTWVYTIEGVQYNRESFGDAFYIIGNLLLLGSLMIMPKRLPLMYPSWQKILEASVMVVGAGVLGWDLIVRPTLTTPEPTLTVVLRVIYPMISLCYLMVIDMARSCGGPATHRAAWRALVRGVLAFGLAESVYQITNYGVAVGEYAELAASIPYIVAYLAMLLAFVRYGDPDPEEHAPVGATPAVSFLPTLITAGVAALLVARVTEHWMLDVSPLALSLILLAALLLVRERQTAHENDRLIRVQVDRDGESRTAALVRQVGDLILLIDSDSRIRFASESAGRLLGVPSDRLGSEPFRTHVHEDDRPALDEALRAPQHAPQAITLRVGPTDVPSRELEVILTDLRHDPVVGGVVLVGRDLTERHELELRLQQAEKLEAVGKLAGGVAHDFNNLLTAILAESELLLHEDPTSEGVRAIRDAAIMGADLTRQLLTFARRQVPSARPIDLMELASTSLRMLGKLDTHIQLEFVAPDPVPLVEADPQQLRQAMLNLLFNARDAMPDGGRLRVCLDATTLGSPLERATLPAAPGTYVRLCVCDTGVGMEPSVLKQAFEPFFTTKDFGMGTGLGLPSVLGILQQHRAGLRLESAPGTGTTVEVFLPVVVPRPQHSVAETTTPVTVRGHERILLVDDETSVRDVTRRLLERLGYDVRAADGGAAAREMLADGWVPDLLVTDVAMPGETGPQVAAALRVRWPSLPILFISGFTAGELTDTGALGQGMSFVSKPYTPVELSHQLRALLQRKETGPGPGTGENDATVSI